MEENLNFKNSKGDNITAILSIVDPTSPIIIIAHGFTSHKNGSSKDISERLAELNINALRFDLESDGKFEDVTISEGTDDILSALSFCKEKGFKKIGLLGTSFGGTCSIMAASKCEDLFLLALRSPVSDYYTRELMTKPKEELDKWKSDGFKVYKNGDGKEFNLKYNFFEDMENNKGFIEAKKIKIPTFIVHGDKDINVPILLSQMLVKVIPNSKLEIIEGAEHRYIDKNLDEKAKKFLLNFISSNIN